VIKYLECTSKLVLMGSMGVTFSVTYALNRMDHTLSFKI